MRCAEIGGDNLVSNLVEADANDLPQERIIPIPDNVHAAIGDGYTDGEFLPRPGDFHEWNGRAWILDTAKDREAERRRIIGEIEQREAWGHRATQALAAGAADENDRAILVCLEQEKQALRAELAALEPAEEPGEATANVQ